LGLQSAIALEKRSSISASFALAWSLAALPAVAAVLRPLLPAEGMAVLSTVASLGAPVAVGCFPVLVALMISGREMSNALVRLAVMWATGLILMCGAALLLSAVHLFALSTLASGVVALSALSLLCLLWFCLSRRQSRGVLRRGIWTRDFQGGLLAVGFGVVAAGLLRHMSPFPFHPGWDVFQHMRIVDGIIGKQAFSLVPSFYSSAFTIDAYTTTFNLMVGVGQTIGGVDLLGQEWAAPFITMPLFALGRTR
jgi:hypothetical protein